MTKTSSPLKTRRLTREEAAKRGVSYGSKHQVDAHIKKGSVTAKTLIYTERQAVNARRGGISKEAYQKAVEGGKRQYASEATSLRQRHAKDGRFISQFVPEMTRADRQIAFKFYDLKDAGNKHPVREMTKDEQQRFKELFNRYPADAIRQAFGSAPKDVGAFQMAA